MAKDCKGVQKGLWNGKKCKGVGDRPEIWNGEKCKGVTVGLKYRMAKKMQGVATGLICGMAENVRGDGSEKSNGRTGMGCVWSQDMEYCSRESMGVRDGPAPLLILRAGDHHLQGFETSAFS